MHRLGLLILIMVFASPLHTTTAQSAPACTPELTTHMIPLPLPDGLLPLDGRQDHREIGRYVADNLNRGVTGEALAAVLAPTYQQPIMRLNADADSDGDEDVAVLLLLPSTGPEFFEELVVLAICHPDQLYRLGDVVSRPLMDYPASRLAAFQDLNRDTWADVVVESKHCGASNCFSSLHLYQWYQAEGSALIPLAEATTDWEFPIAGDEDSGPLLTVTDADGDGSWEITLQGMGYGSNGGGYYRRQTLRWWFDPTLGLWLYQDSFTPADMRIYALQDADRLADHGRFSEAIEAYKALIANPQLADLAPVEVIDGRADNPVNAYAHFRLLVLYTLIGLDVDARATAMEIDARYANLPVSGQFVQLADIFMATHALNTSPCMGVRQALAARTIHWSDMLAGGGYFSNSEYHTGYDTPEAICPF